MEPIERLKLGVQEWLIHHELAGDTAFFTPDEWRARGEDYCTESKLILVFEGGLFSLLNGYSGSVELYDEFDRFVRGFGYFYEMGNAWNMGFYPLDDEPPSSDERRYAEKLRDPRWIENAITSGAGQAEHARSVAKPVTLKSTIAAMCEDGSRGNTPIIC